MICNKHIFQLAEDTPKIATSFLRQTEDYYNKDVKHYCISTHEIKHDDYTTSCSCKSLAKAKVINGINRCECNKCGAVCNRCMFKKKQKGKIENICEGCDYLNLKYNCEINQRYQSRKRPKCEVTEI